MNASAVLLVSAEIREEKEQILSLPRITPLQHSYLQAIAKHPGICANRAGRIIGRKNSSSHEPVKALLRMELVSRRVDPFLSSPTGYSLSLTSKGWHLLTVLQEAGL